MLELDGLEERLKKVFTNITNNFIIDKEPASYLSVLLL